ncbi:MAG TPA: Holliday junction resolvase RuvX [Candidatus Andersenbacteria bacterium]|nr:Holliday junction resolvase RuvX [Candidatus Andersenbacteria bacterium]
MHKIPTNVTPSSSPLVRGRGVIALDIGNRYIGVAAADHVDASLAYRYTTIDRKTQDARTVLADIITKESIDTLVLGVPYHIQDGSETQQTKKTRQFIALLKKTFDPAISYIEVDETLTSMQAKENLQHEESDTKEEHAEAARIMLQEFLSSATVMPDLIRHPGDVDPYVKPGMTMLL